ncbi:MAG: aquaporin family protein [Acidobacteria bacterium]|jgi:glycerol uptake facilitator protein|nr:aquaporin family protein [Acidobacteriota bacterium]
MEAYLAELVGTMLLVIFGDGVVANVCLARTKGHGSGWIVIATGWGLAVALAVYAVGRISGAHINPAVTLGLAAIGAFDASLVPGYLAAQLLGAFLGAVVVWLAYRPHFDATDDAAALRGVFCTAPEIRSAGANFTAELVGTIVLLFGVLAIGANAGELRGGEIDLAAVYSTGISPALVGLLVWGIGLSLGGPTGYAINPARDLGPRLAHAVLPLRAKGDSDWGYAWIPILGPIVGGVAGAWLFRLLGF